MLNNKARLINTILLSSVICISSVYAGSPVGCWKTIDDVAKVDKSYVEISESTKDQDGQKVKVLSATVRQILKLDDPTENPRTKVCKVCEGAKHNEKIEGMEIMWDVASTGDNTWDNGEILDPKTGKVYNVSLKLIEGNIKKSKKSKKSKGTKDSQTSLEVRGYFVSSWLGRTQTWYKVEDSYCNQKN